MLAPIINTPPRLPLQDTPRCLRGQVPCFTRTDLLADRVPDNRIVSKLKRSFHPKRSGNVMVLQEQSWLLYAQGFDITAVHGSPYTYDTLVPIVLAGPGISARFVRRPVGPEDIAPTVAAYLGINAPSGNMGSLLDEAIENTAAQIAFPAQ